MQININIKTKILVFIITCLIIIFGALCLYINFVIKPQNIDETIFIISKMVESTSNEVDAWVNKKAIEYRIISSTPAFSSMDIREITPFINRFTSMYMRNGETMETFSYIGKNGFCWINSKATEELMDYNDYRMAYSEDKEFVIGLPVINKNNREVMLFYYPVLGYGNKKEALICSAVPTVGLKETVNTAQIYSGKTWVMTREHIIITTNEEYFYNNYLDKETLKSIDIKEINSLEVMSVTDAKGQSSTLFFSPVSHYGDWITCTLVKNSILTRSTDEMITGCILLFILLMILTIFLGYFLTNSVMKPIRRLQYCMSQVEYGKLDTYYDINSSKDEIYELGLSYNKMLDEISNLIERIYQEQNEKRNAEMIALQAQIKPHFLYNTLDNLKWMAKKHGAEDVAKTITSLSSLFRIFLSNGQEMITIADEFKHTRCYLEIQSIRYKEKLSYTINLDEDLKHLYIVKIIVQPLVENAIYHGIKPKLGNGHISINGIRVDDFIEITVSDNGIGMTEEKLHSLNEMLKCMDSTQHFGLVNTMRRLGTVYGKDSSMFIESKELIGTTVIVKLPVKEGTLCTEQSLLTMKS